MRSAPGRGGRTVRGNQPSLGDRAAPDSEVSEDLVEVIADRLEHRALEVVGANLDLFAERPAGIGHLLVVSHQAPALEPVETGIYVGLLPAAARDERTGR